MVSSAPGMASERCTWVQVDDSGVCRDKGWGTWGGAQSAVGRVRRDLPQ